MTGTQSDVILVAAGLAGVDYDGKGFIVPAAILPSWKADSASVLAQYEDLTATVLVNRVGNGSVFTILPNAEYASARFPHLVREVLDLALRASGNEPLVEMAGGNPNMDYAVNSSPTGFMAVIVNHNAAEQIIRATPARFVSRCFLKNERGPPSHRSRIEKYDCFKGTGIGGEYRAV